MTDWWVDILKAVIGAGLGSGAVTLWVDRRKRTAEGTYLAMRLAVILEGYAEACDDLIAANKNAWQGRDDRYPDWNTSLPKLAEFPEDGDGWRALDPNMASDCLHLRSRIETSQSLIAEVADFAEDSLEETVRHQASLLGIVAWKLACRMRAASKLKPITPVFDFPGRLQRAKELSDAEAAARGQG